MQANYSFLKKLRTFFLVFGLGFSTSLFSQEICNNGIDDDGDGQIDLNDNECVCTGISIAPSSLIPNPSFEDHSCEPSSFSELNCADGWIQATDATSDYFLDGSFVFGAATAAGLVPFPDGNGAVGAIFTHNYQEYVGSCLASPLISGNLYTLQMNIASTPVTDLGEECNGGIIDYSPIDIVIFGHSNCGELPYPTEVCPGGGWYVLTSVNYTPISSWGIININFTPTANVGAIMIGSPCVLPADYTTPSGCYPYFYFDNLILNESSAFDAQIGLTGDLCTNNLQLSASSVGTGTYQWYYEGVAIAGQTAQSLDVSANSGLAGNYQVTYSEGGGCVVQDTLVVDNSFTMSASNDVSICEGESTQITATGGDTYIWDNGLPSASSHNVSPLSTTVYHVTATNSFGCTDTEDIQVTIYPPIAPVNIIGDLLVCDGETSILDAGSGYTTYNWLPYGQTTRTITVSQSGTYSVTVTNANNCSSTNQVVFNELAPLVVDITGDAIICPSETAILNAGAGFVSYLWSTGESTQTVSVTTEGMYYVTVSDANGCLAVDSINVIQVPVIIPNVGASEENVCVGDQTQLTVTGAGSGGAYNWNLGLGSGQIKDITVLATQDYEVTLTDYYGCTAVGSITITAIPIPVLSVTPSNPTICRGSAITLTASGADTYSWFPPYGLSGTQGPAVVANPEYTTDYIITGMNTVGTKSCTSTLQMQVIVDDLSVSLPISQTLCEGTEVNMYANTSGGVAPFTYTWIINSNGTSFTTQSLTYIIDTITNFKVIVTDGNGCVMQANTTYQDYPDLILDLLFNDATVCPKDTVLLNAAISGGTGVPYQFIFEDKYSDVILKLIPETTHWYVGEARDGCKSVKDSVQIITHPIPYLDFIADEYAGCVPMDIRFSSVSAPSDLISDYFWNFGDSDQNNLSLTNSPLHIYEYKGDFSVKLEALTVDGCRIDTIKHNLIHIEPKPVLSFIAQPAYVSIIKPLVYFNNTSVNRDSLSYIWDFGTGDYSNLQSPEYTYKYIGNYEVEMIGFTAYGCSDTVMGEVRVQPEIAFYIPTAFTPDGDNFNEVFMPKGSNILNTGYLMRIYNRWGEPIFESVDLSKGWDGKTAQGNFAKTDSYIYYIEFYDIYGIRYEKNGNLNLIR